MARKNITQFEETLASLEALVEQLEKGDLSLEESLKSFEKTELVIYYIYILYFFTYVIPSIYIIF